MDHGNGLAQKVEIKEEDKSITATTSQKENDNNLGECSKGSEEKTQREHDPPVSKWHIVNSSCSNFNFDQDIRSDTSHGM